MLLLLGESEGALQGSLSPVRTLSIWLSPIKLLKLSTAASQDRVTANSSTCWAFLFQNEELEIQRRHWTEMQQEYEETITDLRRNLGMTSLDTGFYIAQLFLTKY